MDSAFYSEDNVKETGLIKWINRVPETIKEAVDLIIHTDKATMRVHDQEGYRYKEHTSHYGFVDQKWVVVFSEQAYAREEKTLNKNIRKEHERIEKDLWHLANRVFNCPEDSIKALENLTKKWKYHHVKSYEVNTANKTQKRGRPKRNDSAIQKVFSVNVAFEEDQENIVRAKSKLGKFIIASNDTTLPGAEMLKEYKAQQSVGRGFRFIKDPMFFTSSIFLKSPRRIVALVMIMALSLLVFSIGQHKIRSALKKYNETILNQLKKPTQKPTLRWVFQMFEGIHYIEYIENGQVRRQITNLKEHHLKIIRLLGPFCEKTYFIE